jgi:hypothetical protein
VSVLELVTRSAVMGATNLMEMELRLDDPFGIPVTRSCDDPLVRSVSPADIPPALPKVANSCRVDSIGDPIDPVIFAVAPALVVTEYVTELSVAEPWVLPASV